MQRFRIHHDTIVVLFLLAVTLWRGPRLFSLGYLDAASRSLIRALPLEAAAAGASRPGLPRVVSLLGTALRWDARNERARLQAARVTWRQDGCEAALQAWPEGFEQDAVAVFERAEALRACGYEDEALVQYRRVRSCALYLGFLAEQDLEAGQLRPALELLQLSMVVSPTLEVAQRLAELYGDAAEPEMQGAVWQELSAATAPSDPLHWWAQGQAADAQQDWEGAASAYATGATLAVEPCRFWQSQSAALYQLERWQELEAVCASAQQSCRNQVWPYLRAGDARRAQSDHSGALEWYRQAAKLWPDLGPVHYLIGLTLYEQGSYAEAEEQLRQALSLDAGDADSAYYLARCLHESGRTAEAAETLAAAIDMRQAPAWRWALLLGDWKFEQGDRQGALQAYLRAQQWAPEEERIRDRIRRLQSDAP